jgi:hypothetical protein
LRLVNTFNNIIMCSIKSLRLVRTFIR